jgi:hypothetical protein
MNRVHLLPGARVMRAFIGFPQAHTRAAISCGTLIIIALVALGVLYVLADRVAANEIRAAIEFLPSPSFADVFRH